MLFCTPEYAGALPGSFKNLLDWTVGTGALHGKPVGWVNVANPGRGEGALAELITVLGYVGAKMIDSACLREPALRESIGPDGAITDVGLQGRLTTALHALVAGGNDALS